MFAIVVVLFLANLWPQVDAAIKEEQDRRITEDRKLDVHEQLVQAVSSARGCEGVSGVSVWCSECV